MISSLPPQNPDGQPWTDDIVTEIVLAFYRHGFMPYDLPYEEGSPWSYLHIYNDRGARAYIIAGIPRRRSPLADDDGEENVAVRIQFETNGGNPRIIELVFTHSDARDEACAFNIDLGLLKDARWRRWLVPLFLAYADVMRTRRLSKRQATEILRLMVECLERLSREDEG